MGRPSRWHTQHVTASVSSRSTPIARYRAAISPAVGPSAPDGRLTGEQRPARADQPVQPVEHRLRQAGRHLPRAQHAPIGVGVGRLQQRGRDRVGVEIGIGRLVPGE